jgi:hypothetical protein
VGRKKAPDMRARVVSDWEAGKGRRRRLARPAAAARPTRVIGRRKRAARAEQAEADAG